MLIAPRGNEQKIERKRVFRGAKRPQRSVTRSVPIQCQLPLGHDGKKQILFLTKNRKIYVFNDINGVDIKSLYAILGLTINEVNMKIECPKCKQQYSVEDALVGEEVECTACNHVFVVQKKEPFKLEKANPSSEEQSGIQTPNETTIKRIQILMELQEWDKARMHCEKALDSAPENPDLYLLLCLINHKLTNEALLTESNCDLAEDKHFVTAIKFASAERKQQLLDIQSKSQKERIRQYEFYLWKCMKQNMVSTVSMLSKSKNALTEDFFFQKALEYAPSEQKEMLIHLQEEQDSNTSFMRKIWRNIKKIGKAFKLGAAIGIVFGIIAVLWISFTNKYADVEEKVLCAAIFLSAGGALGALMGAFWKKFFKQNTKITTIALNIISGTVLGSVVFAFISSGIDYSGSPRLRKKVSFFECLINNLFDSSFLFCVLIVILFSCIWCVIWYHMEKTRKKEELQRLQDIESEYLLLKEKESEIISKEKELEQDQKSISSSNDTLDHSLQSLEEYHSLDMENIITKSKEKYNRRSDIIRKLRRFLFVFVMSALTCFAISYLLGFNILSLDEWYRHFPWAFFIEVVMCFVWSFVICKMINKNEPILFWITFILLSTCLVFYVFFGALSFYWHKFFIVCPIMLFWYGISKQIIKLSPEEKLRKKETPSETALRHAWERRDPAFEIAERERLNKMLAGLPEKERQELLKKQAKYEARQDEERLF